MEDGHQVADNLWENEDSLDFKNSIMVCKCKEQGSFFFSLKEQRSSDNVAAPSPGAQISWKLRRGPGSGAGRAVPGLVLPAPCCTGSSFRGIKL